MAEETMTEKIYCMPQDNGNNAALWANAMKDDNSWNNNPFAYLIWLMAMRWINNDGTTTGENFNSRQIAALQDTVNNNANTQTVMSALSNNQAAIRELAQTFNADINAIQGAVSGVRSAIEQVGGQVGMSAERVINAVNLGDLNLIQQLKDCCCTTQKSILTQGYENQLAIQAQTQQLGNQVNDVRNALVNGFAQTGYATQAQTCDIINAINASQQKTNDLLTTHWAAETSQALQDAKFEISQLKQNQYLANIINGGCNCNG